MSGLREWLNSISLGAYADAFEAGDIDWDVLPELDHEVLRELGVSSPGDRLRILKAVKRLAENGAPAPGTVTAPPAPVPVAERPEPGGEAERRQLTVMFCDLVGSTALSEALDPEDLREVINAYQQCAVSTAERLGGHVARYMGDGILVYFGYPRADEHDAVHAVRAGLAVTDAVSRLVTAGGQRLQTRVGIATGLVVVGDLVESAIAKEHTVVGETPNLAARLQSLAAPDQVVVSDVTRRLSREVFEFEDLGVQPLKGFSEPVMLWRAMGERGSIDSDGCGIEGQADLPLVGREREVGLLVDRWESAADGDGQVVLLAGQAGMGKTRILTALLEAVGGRPHVAVRYFCSPYHAASALHPVAEQLVHAARIAGTDPAEVGRRKLEALLRDPMFGASEALLHDASYTLSRVLGIEAPGESGVGMPTAEQMKERTLDTLVELLCAMSETSPVIVALEDAQWADPTTRELFDAFAERTHDLPVLLVVTYRGDFEPAWADFPHVTTLSLNRLGAREVDALVRALCGGRRLPETVHERIVANTDGIPLFVEELTRGVLESGLLIENSGRLELTGPLPPFAIPVTLHDSLMARLDRLDTAKELAQVGAAIGRSFPRCVVESVSSLPPEDDELGEAPESGDFRARAHALRGDLESLHGRLEDANEAYEQALAATPDPEFTRDVEVRLHRVHETTRSGARIVYYVHGSGTETLLFVNPIAYGLAMFQPVLERLCHEFRVVTVDCRGAGRSDPIVRPYSIEQHARDTAAVIDHLGVGAVVGVGVSRGGSQLIRLAAERPELVKAVVLIGTPFHVDVKTAVQEDSPQGKAQLDALARGDWDQLYDAFARSLYTEPSVRHLTRQFVLSCAALPLETMRSFFDGDPKLNVAHLLPAIEYPVLITHGTDDQRVSVANAHEFHEAIAGSSLHVFDGKGHLPVFSAPEEFCGILRQFVSVQVSSGPDH